MAMLSLIALSSKLQAQSTDMDPLLHVQHPGWSTVVLSQSASSSGIPFWFQANRGGYFPDQSSRNTSLMLRYSQAKKKLMPGIEYEWAGAVTSLFSDSRKFIRSGSAIFVDQLSIRLEGYHFRFQVGKYHEMMGRGAPYLSTGRMMLSANAKPAWKISLDTPHFIDVPYLNGFVAFKGRWSEEWTSDSRFVNGAMVNRKHAYINVRPVPQLNLIGGIVHNVMYGGTHPELGKTHDFSTYFRDIFGLPYGESKTPLGNGVAAYDFELAIRTKKWTLAGSRIFYLEDKVSANIRSPWDGLWAGWFQLHGKERPVLVDYIMYEHMNTLRQDAMGYDLLGRAKYGTHHHWRSGYTHHERFFGTSLFGFTPTEITEFTTPVTNNMIVAHHAGVKGDLSGTMIWAVKATYTRNYGICSDQLPAEISRVSCYHKNYENMNMREMSGVVPLRELRKDRYSVWIAVTKSWLSDRTEPIEMNDKTNKNTYSYTLKVALAADWGEYVGKRKIGSEISFQIHF